MLKNIKSSFIKAAFIWPLSLIVSGCERSPLVSADAATTKAEVLKHAPLGTPIEQAKSYMEGEGFKCIRMQNQRYVDESTLQGHTITRGPAELLWCDSGELTTWQIVITKRWQVSFEDAEGKVSYVAVDVGLTGP
jgi:hypothetical protein